MDRAAISAEMLMAFADGELGPAERAAAEAAVAADPALATRLANVEGTRSALRAAMPAAPLPDALAARIRALGAQAEAGEVVPLRPAAASRPVAVWWPAALAAPLALAAGLALGWFAGQGRDMPGAVADAGGLSPAVRSALGTLPSGDMARDGAATVRAVATIRDTAGALWREVGVTEGRTARIVVACRGSAGREERLAVRVAAAEGAFVPIGAQDTVEAWMAANGASDALDPAAEAAALAAGQ